MDIEVRTGHCAGRVSDGDIDRWIGARADRIDSVRRGEAWDRRWLGWFDPAVSASPEILESLHAQAVRVRGIADTLIVIGIGGSNRGAMAAIQAMHRSLRSAVRIFWAGDTLSSSAMQAAIEVIKTRSVVLNVIAKDFNTVEPGIAFRMLRGAMIERYGDGYADRIVATGSRGPGQLHELALRHGYHFLDFPREIGGRFSVLSEVGLFPMAVAGVDIDSVTAGARKMAAALRNAGLMKDPAIRYVAARHLLFGEGFPIESLVLFEPDLVPFAKWWTQLFAETEGKNDKALFPTWFSYSEDLHAVGQLVQQGGRRIIETYLDLFNATQDLVIGASDMVRDGFDYLTGKRFDDLGRAVYGAAIEAHASDGVPCIELVPGGDGAEGIAEGSLGALFYFFMYAAAISATLNGADPFTQDGVEAYKRNMYRRLGKHA